MASLALHAATAEPRHGTCQALITLTRRPLSVSRAHHVLSSCVLCAWRRLPLIGLKLLVGVRVRDGLAASVCARRTSDASFELLPRGWRAVAFWLHVLAARRGSLFVVASAACALASLALIVILHSLLHPPSRVLWLLKRCSCCRARRYSCSPAVRACHAATMDRDNAIWFSFYICMYSCCIG